MIIYCTPCDAIASNSPGLSRSYQGLRSAWDRPLKGAHIAHSAEKDFRIPFRRSIRRISPSFSEIFQTLANSFNPSIPSELRKTPYRRKAGRDAAVFQRGHGDD